MAARVTSDSGATNGSEPGTPWYLTATSLAAVPWLARLQWARAAVDLVVVIIAVTVDRAGIDVPLAHVAPMLVATALCHAVIARGAGHRVPRTSRFAAYALQPVLLTELLELTGGPFNPFAVVYAAPIALAWLTLGSTAGAVVSACSAVGYTMLAYWHLTEQVAGHHRLNDVPTHLFTLWVSLALTAELAAYFVVQASNALARREAQLEQLRQQAARAERLASLTTLAAGAAHELSTPLGTIALAARELEHTISGRADLAPLADDAHLIRAEVDRCRAVLDRMSGRAGGSAVDAPDACTVSALVADLDADLPRHHAGRVTINGTPAAADVRVPRSALSQAVLALVGNALDALDVAGATGGVFVDISVTESDLTVRVRDGGPGMSPETLQRAGEPFFTTKPPGRGLGLGLFLVRVFAERLGGTLSLESAEGTVATLALPRWSSPVEVSPWS